MATDKVYVWSSVLHSSGGDRRYEYDGYDIGEYAARVSNMQELRELCRERNVHFPKKYRPLQFVGSVAKSLPDGHGMWFRSIEDPTADWLDVPPKP